MRDGETVVTNYPDLRRNKLAAHWCCGARPCYNSVARERKGKCPKVERAESAARRGHHHSAELEGLHQAQEDVKRLGHPAEARQRRVADPVLAQVLPEEIARTEFKVRVFLSGQIGGGMARCDAARASTWLVSVRRSESKYLVCLSATQREQVLACLANSDAPDTSFLTVSSNPPPFLFLPTAQAILP